MDDKLLDYYNEELTFIRQMGAEFAQQHPKVARRLGMQATEVADPYVERLMEAFCLMSARTRIKLDAEFPRLSERLLELVYPNYVAPTPSMSVARLYPDEQAGDLSKGYTLAAGSALHARQAWGERTAVQFRTGHDVTLWPLELAQAQLAGSPPDVPGLSGMLPSHIQVRSCLRLRLRTQGGVLFSQLEGLDDLSVYLPGEEQLATHIQELVLSSAIGWVTLAPEQTSATHLQTEDAVVNVGFEPHESLLPETWNGFHGHRLLQSYFACPSQFLFFGLNALQPAFQKAHTTELEVIVLLSRPLPSWAAQVDAQQFALFCTPVINLFPMRAQRLQLRGLQTQIHVVPDRTRPLDYEVHSVLQVDGDGVDPPGTLTYAPLYQSVHADGHNHGRYFSVQRQPRVLSKSAQANGARSNYLGSEVYVSLVDQYDAPWPQNLRYLSAQLLVTNRDLAMVVPRDGLNDLAVPQSAPITRCALVRPPSAARPSLVQEQLSWRLIRQLSLNHLSLLDLDGVQGAQTLREILRLYAAEQDQVASQQIEGLVRVDARSITRRLPGAGPLVYGRGVELRLEMDETCFSGGSAFLLGQILQRFLARHVSLNTFTQTSLTSLQRGPVHTWPVRSGQRPIV